MTKEKIYQMFGILIAIGGALHVTSMDVMENMTVLEVLKQFVTGMLIFIIGMLIAVWNVPVDYFK